VSDYLKSPLKSACFIICC